MSYRAQHQQISPLESILKSQVLLPQKLIKFFVLVSREDELSSQQQVRFCVISKGFLCLVYECNIKIPILRAGIYFTTRQFCKRSLVSTGWFKTAVQCESCQNCFQTPSVMRSLLQHHANSLDRADADSDVGIGCQKSLQLKCTKILRADWYVSPVRKTSVPQTKRYYHKATVFPTCIH